MGKMYATGVGKKPESLGGNFYKTCKSLWKQDAMQWP